MISFFKNNLNDPLLSSNSDEIIKIYSHAREKSNLTLVLSSFFTHKSLCLTLSHLHSLTLACLTHVNLAFCVSHSLKITP